MADLNNLTTKDTLNDLLDAGYDFSDLCDEATTDCLTQRFGFRHVQKKFITFFERQLVQYYPRYLQMLRVDPTLAEYDWFVENYMERLQQNNEQSIDNISRSETSENHGSKTNNVSFSHTGSGSEGDLYEETNSRANTHTGRNSSNSTHTGSNSETVNENHSETTNETNLSTETSRVAPMSASLNGTRTAGGKSMTWNDINNPTSSGEKLIDDNIGVSGTSGTSTIGSDGSTDIVAGTENSTDTTNGGVNSSNTKTKSDSASDLTTGTITDNASSSRDGEESRENERASETKIIVKGRNVSISELIMQAATVIRGTNAFEYLCGELEPCFIASFDIEDYD